MTDTHDAEVIAHLRRRVDDAGRLPFISVDTSHLRVLYARLDELTPPAQSDADGVVAAVLLQASIAAAPGDLF